MLSIKVAICIINLIEPLSVVVAARLVQLQIIKDCAHPQTRNHRIPDKKLVRLRSQESQRSRPDQWIL
jgi:hypothetical protein